MIHRDSSVALAYLLAEDRCPSDELWDELLVSSRLLECEVWTRINAARTKLAWRGGTQLDWPRCDY
jgi:hypothetical protein